MPWNSLEGSWQNANKCRRNSLQREPSRTHNSFANKTNMKNVVFAMLMPSSITRPKSVGLCACERGARVCDSKCLTRSISWNETHTMNVVRMNNWIHIFFRSLSLFFCENLIRSRIWRQCETLHATTICPRTRAAHELPRVTINWNIHTFRSYVFMRSASKVIGCKWN